MIRFRAGTKVWVHSFRRAVTNPGNATVQVLTRSWVVVPLTAVSAVGFVVLLDLLEGLRTLPVTVGPFPGAAVIAVVVMGTARTAFALRQRQLRVYALVELGAGAAMAMHASIRGVASNADDLAWLLALVSATYVAVRGLDNWAKAAHENH